MDSLAHHQKKAQKKKRKKKPAEPLEHRGSTSSETELPPPLQELHLTDDLADFMVNPPTEPECSDEETLSCSQEAGGNLTRDPTLTSFQISPDTESAAPLQLDVELAAPLAAPMGEEEERSGQESAEMAADYTSTSSQREEPEGTPLPLPTTDEEAEVETVESVAATAAVEVLSLNAGDLDTKAMDTTAMDVAETVYVDPVNVGNTGLWVLVMRLLRGRAILPPLWAPPVIPKWMWLLKNLHQETNTSAATAQNMSGRVPSQLIPQKSLQPAHSQPVSSPPHQPSHTAQSAGQALSCPFQPHPLTWSRRRRRRGRRRSQ